MQHEIGLHRMKNVIILRSKFWKYEEGSENSTEILLCTWPLSPSMQCKYTGWNRQNKHFLSGWKLLSSKLSLYYWDVGDTTGPLKMKLFGPDCIHLWVKNAKAFMGSQPRNSPIAIQDVWFQVSSDFNICLQFEIPSSILTL